MTIQLVIEEDMKTGRGRKETGEKYSKYKNAIAPHVQFLREGIAKAKDGSIRVKVIDIAEAMGMTGKHETSIYWGLKYVLFGEGLVVTTGQTKNDEPVLIMREKREGDVLPPSLTKHLGSDVEVPDGPEETLEEHVDENEDKDKDED